MNRYLKFICPVCGEICSIWRGGGEWPFWHLQCSNHIIIHRARNLTELETEFEFQCDQIKKDVIL